MPIASIVNRTHRSSRTHRAHRARRRLGVVLVDPLPVVRAGIALLIDDRPDMEVLAEAGTADEALEIVSRRAALAAS